RIFFINPEHTLQKYKNKASYKYTFKLCKFFALLYILDANKINIKNKLLTELEFNQDNFLANLLENQKKLNTLDRGIEVIDNEIHLIETNDLQNVLKVAFLQRFNNKTSELGNLFEDYVHHYCINKYSDNYDFITTSINCEGLESCKDIKPDIDMTIYDKQRDFYYFTQIKYTLIHKPYLKDEIKTLCDSNSLKTGIRQLRDFKSALKFKEFRDRLDELNINIKNNNFALILIHNTFQYDFQKIEDIQLYEWNSFRNLLNKGNQNIGNLNLTQPSISSIQNNDTLELQDVDKAMEISIKNNPSDINKEWSIFYRTLRHFELNGKRYLSNIK
uniref:hypothetical protein n=1 Tax=Arcobacter sp. TaxID=1872629 RepID=UPI003D0BEDC8